MDKKEKYLVYFDFDNTITTLDTLDDIIERFAINNDWIEIEQAWKKGKIGSRECLKGQLGLVRITKPRLAKYLSKIKIDPHFKKILLLLKRKKIKPVILSDNFSYIINFVLHRHGIIGMKVYSNRLKFAKDRLRLAFPHANPACFHCGHCKKSNLKKNNFRDKIIYIGDGLSDVCPAEFSDIVYAKGSLLRHFKKKNKSHIAFKDLGDVYLSLKENILNPICSS